MVDVPHRTVENVDRNMYLSMMLGIDSNLLNKEEQTEVFYYIINSVKNF